MNNLTHVRFLGGVLISVGLGPARLSRFAPPAIEATTPATAERFVLWLCEEDQETALAYFEALRTRAPIAAEQSDGSLTAAIAALETLWHREAELGQEPAALIALRDQVGRTLTSSERPAAADLAREVTTALAALNEPGAVLSPQVKQSLMQSCAAVIATDATPPKRLSHLLAPTSGDTAAPSEAPLAAAPVPASAVELCRQRLTQQVSGRIDVQIEEIATQRSAVGLPSLTFERTLTAGGATALGHDLLRCEQDFVRRASGDLAQAVRLNAAAAQVRMIRALLCEHHGQFTDAAEHFARALRHLNRNAADEDGIGRELARGLITALLLGALLDDAPDGLLKARDQAIQLTRQLAQAPVAARLSHASLLATIELAVARRHDHAQAFDQVDRITADLAAEARLAQLPAVAARATLMRALAAVMKFGQLGVANPVFCEAETVGSVASDISEDPESVWVGEACLALKSAHGAVAASDAGSVVLALADVDRAATNFEQSRFAIGPLHVMLAIDLGLMHARLSAARTLNEAQREPARAQLLAAAEQLSQHFRGVEVLVSPGTRALVHIDFSKLLAAASRYSKAPELIATAASLTADAMTTLATVNHPLAADATDGTAA